MVYCYTTKDGVTIRRNFPMGKAPKQVRVEGRRARRDFRAEGRSISTVPSNYPRESDSMGVAPSQVKEAYEASVEAGCPTQFTSEGSAIITSAQHDKALARSLAMHQNNAGWNDPVPN